MFRRTCLIRGQRILRQGRGTDSPSAGNHAGTRFLLFTSYAQMHDIYDRLLGELRFSHAAAGERAKECVA